MIGQNSTSADQTEVDHCALGHELECFMTFASPDNITSDRWPGVGGFTPYGFNGILKGLQVKMSENNLRFYKWAKMSENCFVGEVQKCQKTDENE